MVHNITDYLNIFQYSAVAETLILEDILRIVLKSEQ